jgi:hypothetical protein
VVEVKEEDVILNFSMVIWNTDGQNALGFVD